MGGKEPELNSSFSLSFLSASNNLLPSLLLSFPLHPSVLHDLSHTTVVGPVSAAAPEGTLGRKRSRGVSVPVLRCISVQSLNLTSGPNPALGVGGCNMLQRGLERSFLHPGGMATKALTSCTSAFQKDQKGLNWFLFNVVFLPSNLTGDILLWELVVSAGNGPLGRFWM